MWQYKDWLIELLAGSHAMAVGFWGKAILGSIWRDCHHQCWPLSSVSILCTILYHGTYTQRAMLHAWITHTLAHGLVVYIMRGVLQYWKAVQFGDVIWNKLIICTSHYCLLCCPSHFGLVFVAELPEVVVIQVIRGGSCAVWTPSTVEAKYPAVRSKRPQIQPKSKDRCCNSIWAGSMWSTLALRWTPIMSIGMHLHKCAIHVIWVRMYGWVDIMCMS